MVEGGVRIITNFLEQQLAQSAVITVVPRFVGGVNALQPAAGTSLPPPRLSPVAYTPAGEDLVIWGNLTFPEALAVQPELQQKQRP
jgi:3,4-dihydroxy 2-butanone 4-phosphate synthase/GTP cyclohydrolase II